ncbi:MAG: hypothetical protein KatS3mg010_2111 [Acidimicrobiia bacterium]|nr:MAG: hypothetical protein KatS3mg010_2111 [Acidimicrobiia bacterium]
MEPSATGRTGNRPSTWRARATTFGVVVSGALFLALVAGAATGRWRVAPTDAGGLALVASGHHGDHAVVSVPLLGDAYDASREPFTLALIALLSASLVAWATLREATRARRRAVTALTVVLVTLGAAPAPAVFLSTPHVTAVSFGTVADGPKGLTCTFTGASSIRLDWSAPGGGTLQVYRRTYTSTSTGSFAAYGSPVAGTTATSTDASASTPFSNLYAYYVSGSGIGSWSKDTGKVLATACRYGIATIAAQAGSVRLYAPEMMTFDDAGNLYFADTSNHRIRRIDALTGRIETVAGDGTTAYDVSEEDASALSASLHSPQGVAVDDAGNLYISDSGHHMIRKVAAGTGTITRIGGTGSSGNDAGPGVATSIKIDQPTGIAVTGDGSTVYFADNNNHKLRKINGGTMTTVAGSTAGFLNGTCLGTVGNPASNCQLSAPDGIALDPGEAYVYIADRANRRVRRWTIATGVMETWAGTGTAGSTDGNRTTTAQFDTPEAVAVDPTDANKVYVADRDNKKIRLIDASTNAVSTYVGTGSTGPVGTGYPALSTNMNFPRGVGVSPDGVVHYSDTGNNMIRKRVATGDVVTVAGADVAGAFAGDYSVASTGDITTPMRMASDDSGNIYFADYAQHRIRKWIAATGAVVTIAGTGTSGNTGDGGPATAARLYSPMGVDVDAAGNVYIADFGNHTIRRIDATTGTISRIAGTGAIGNSGDGGAATSATLYAPKDVAVSDDGQTVYIADSSNNRIRKLTWNAALSRYDISHYSGSAAGTSGCSDNATPTNGTHWFPNTLSLAANGDLYVGEDFCYKVRRIASGGALTTVAGTGGPCSGSVCGDGGAATSGTFKSVDEVHHDGTYVWVADGDLGRLRRFTVGGSITSYLGNGSGGVEGGRAADATIGAVVGVATDPSGNLYFANDTTVRRSVGPHP